MALCIQSRVIIAEAPPSYTAACVPRVRAVRFAATSWPACYNERSAQAESLRREVGYARVQPGADQGAARPDARGACLCAAHDLPADPERRHAAVLRRDRRRIRVYSRQRADDRLVAFRAGGHR